MKGGENNLMPFKELTISRHDFLAIFFVVSTDIFAVAEAGDDFRNAPSFSGSRCPLKDDVFGVGQQCQYFPGLLVQHVIAFFGFLVFVGSISVSH